MENSLFDELKDLKKDLAQTQKEANQKQEKTLKEEKEKKLQNDFISFMEKSGITKIK
ncbi:hypothetical protein [Sulfurospirillum arcachonense]|uniref:hypothetical protein n=1 Tax=Sulfurospirillum arcachonense TaxID=57666 RepID=UPI0004AD5992|nr:hypothetical protein [Sulfurospirillum arcachonense]